MRMRSRISTSLTVMPWLPRFGGHRFFVDELLQDLAIDAELPEQLLVHLRAVRLAVGVHLRRVAPLERAHGDRLAFDLGNRLARRRAGVVAQEVGDIEDDKGEDDERQAPLEPALVPPHPIQHGHDGKFLGNSDRSRFFCLCFDLGLRAPPRSRRRRRASGREPKAQSRAAANGEAGRGCAIFSQLNDLRRSRRLDLAARLGRSHRALKGRLERPEATLAMMRAAHELLDPGQIGELVLEEAGQWFKAPSAGVFAPDLDGQLSRWPRGASARPARCRAQRRAVGADARTRAAGGRFAQRRARPGQRGGAGVAAALPGPHCRRAGRHRAAGVGAGR